MAKQVSSYNPATLAKVELQAITFEGIANTPRRDFPSKLSDGQFFIEFRRPYTRKCFDIYDVATGVHIERCHTESNVYAAFKKLKAARGC